MLVGGHPRMGKAALGREPGPAGSLPADTDHVSLGSCLGHLTLLAVHDFADKVRWPFTSGCSWVASPTKVAARSGRSDGAGGL